ncbi:hypothetical protein DFJ73DRAFT_868033 [Zopfochytrium polystomum]|nr:hypothetical protein DFJ73DRAFT_868033 [Zopfochytrium polystomum]
MVRSFVNDLLVPPLSFVAGDTVRSRLFFVLKRGRTLGAKYRTLDEAAADGAITINIGRFGHNCFNFLVVGLAVYHLLRGLKAFFEFQVTIQTRKCPYCYSDIHELATRCAFCTAVLPAASASTPV